MFGIEPDWRQRLSIPVSAVGRLLLTLAVGLAGGGAFFLLGAPAAWLSGPAVSVAGASLAGVRLSIPNPVRQAAFVFLGSTMGATMTPETLALMARWPVSVAGLAVCVLGIMICCSAYLHYVHGYDRTTARLAAVPGALPYVLALAAESRGDQYRIAIIQIFRLAALLIFLPSVLALFGYSAESITPEHAVPVRHAEVALMLVGGAAGAYVFARLKAPAASLFGSMVGAGILYATGTLSSPIPDWLLLPGFLVIGATVGTNFSGIDRYLIFDTLLASIGSLLVGAVVALMFAVPVAWLLGLTVAQLWLAYSPGGVDVMTIMAMALGLDPAFVGGHHVARFIGLGFVVPVWLRIGMQAEERDQ